MSLKKNLGYNFLLSVSQVAFPLISIPYISRILEPAGIGSVSFIDSLTYYFIVIAEFGITTYGIREVSRKRRDKIALEKLVSELLSLHLITSAISVLIYSVTIFFLYQKIGDFRLVLFSLSFLLVNAFTCEWYFWGTEKFQYITTRTLITRLLGLASLFILVRRPEDFITYYAIITISAIVNIIWNYSKMFSEVTIRFRNLNWKVHMRYVLITYLISLVYSVPLFLDSVLLGLVSTTAAVAYYSFAVRIVRISSALVTDSFLVLYPKTVSLLHEQEHVQARLIITASSDIILLATIPIGFGIFLLAKDFTLAYFGAAFMPVAFNLKILCFFPLIKAFSLFLNKQLLMPQDMERLILKGLVAGMIVFLLAAILLSAYLGSGGTCIAIVLSEVVILLFNVVHVKRNLSRIRLVKSSTVSQALISSLFFLPIVYGLDFFISNSLIKIVLSILLCIFIYLLILFKYFKNPVVVSAYQSGLRKPKHLE